MAIATGVAAGPPTLPPGSRLEENLVYARRGKVALGADLIVPPGKGPFPVVLLVHGGGWREGNRDRMRGSALHLANRGYASLAISYRFAPAFRHPAQLEDCREAVRWIRANATRYSLDGGRIAGWGISAGGHLVALLATTGNEPGGERIGAAVTIGAPTDLRTLDTAAGLVLLPPFLGAKREASPDLYRNASPVAHVDAGDPPMFVANGDSDPLVPLAQAETLAGALQRANVRVELRPMKHTAHSHFTPDLFAAIRDAVRFLDRELSAPPAADRGTRR